MKIVILGSNGQLGSDLLTSQLINGNEMIPLRRGECDISALDEIDRVLGNMDFDVLMNCTGYHKTDEVEDHPLKAYLINARAVEKMAGICEEKGARFIHISTDYVFEGNHTHPYNEMDLVSPINVYGVSKALGEDLALSACSNTYVLRVASLFGLAGSSGKGGNFIETIKRLGTEKGQVKAVDDVIMSPTSTKDVAYMITILLKKLPKSGIYHAVNTGAVSWYTFAKKILQLNQIPASVKAISQKTVKARAKRPCFSALDNNKLSKVIGHIPGWEEALEHYCIDKARQGSI